MKDIDITQKYMPPNASRRVREAAIQSNASIKVHGMVLDMLHRLLEGKVKHSFDESGHTTFQFDIEDSPEGHSMVLMVGGAINEAFPEMGDGYALGNSKYPSYLFFVSKAPESVLDTLNAKKHVIEHHLRHVAHRDAWAFGASLH